jgi:hypothetical protein
MKVRALPHVQLSAEALFGMLTARAQMAMMAADNLVAGVQGKTLPFAVKL